MLSFNVFFASSREPERYCRCTFPIPIQVAPVEFSPKVSVPSVTVTSLIIAWVKRAVVLSNADSVLLAVKAVVPPTVVKAYAEMPYLPLGSPVLV